MTKTLTEQWREGKLPQGWYYCQCYNELKKLYCGDGESLELDDPETAAYYFFHRNHDKGQVEVLEPVPSYNEVKRLQERLNECEEALVEAYYDCYNEGFEPDLAKEYLKKYGVE